MTREDARHRGGLLVVNQRCGMRRCRPPHVPAGWIARLAAAVSLALALASCASVEQTIGGWLGVATPTPTPKEKAAAAAPRVYFAGAEAVKVYSEPSASSTVLGELSLHEKVTRFKLERGFAYVESGPRGLKGWVRNSELIWRLPSGATTTAPATAEPESEGPAAEEAPPPQAAETPTPQATETPATAAEPTAMPTHTAAAAPPSPKATPGGVAPSIFNPY
jgi:hypothetical protein